MPTQTRSPVAPLPGVPGFQRMTAAAFNAHLLAGSAAQAGGQGSMVREVASKRRKSPEEDLHRLVFEWIFVKEMSHPLLRHAMHVPNGGARSKGEAGKLKAMGVRPGVSDVICPFKSGYWSGFACELKAPKGRCTPEQTEFLEKARADGWLTGVCYSFEQFLDMVEAYLAGTPAQALPV